MPTINKTVSMQSIENAGPLFNKNHHLLAGIQSNNSIPRPVVGVSQLKIYGSNKSASRSIERSRQMNINNNRRSKHLIDSPPPMKPSIIPMVK